MAENKDIQIQVKKTPAFTVLKNNSIIKTIFLLRKPPPFDTSPMIQQDSDEEILLVGRHPDCNITVEHPSISRYHLRIHSNPSSQMLSVIDLSTVHETWVSGKRIELGVRVNLKEGDTVKMGGSSRVYELHWVSLSQAYDDDDLFVPAVYSIKEVEEETNQDGKPEAHSSDDDLECLNLLSSEEIKSSSLNKLNPLTSPVHLLNSSCDDTKVEHLSPSKIDSENGEIYSTVLDQPPLVSGTTSAIKDSDTLSKTENQSNWSRDNISLEFEPQNHGIIEDDSLSVPNRCISSCSDDMEVEHLSPLKTGHENGEIYTITEAISESDMSSWLRDNMIDEYEPQNHGIIKDDPFSVTNCSNSSCDDTEVEHSIPLITGYENGEISTTIEAISESEDLPNWLRDNKSDEFEQLGHVTTKDDSFSVPNCSISSCDDTEVEHTSPLQTGHENGEISITTEAISESEYLSNLLRDNMSNKFEQLGHETTNDDLVSVPNCLNSSCDDTKVEHSFPLKTVCEIGGNSTTTEAISKSDQCKSLMDNMNDEVEQLSHGTTEDNLVSAALLDVIETHEKDVLYQDISRCNEVQMCNGNEHGSFMLNRAGDKEDIVGFELEQMNQTKMMNEFNSVVLFDAVDSKVDKDHDVTQKETVFVALPDGTDMDQEQDFTPEVSRAEEVYMNPKAMKNSSVSRTLFSSSDGSDLEVFSPDKENKDPNTCLAKSLKKRSMKDEHKQSNHHTMSKKRWTMVVDTKSLLHSKSLEDMKLLQGLKGTQLYIPKLVLRELMKIKCQNDHLVKSMKKASLALKWIDECMVNTRWWIHIDDEILRSSKAELGVLKTALYLRKETTYRNIIILSNDLTLKIKAMAEGVMCETADEFRRSLVNPFSERFMWVGSSPRGPTCTCLDDYILRRKYHGCGINTSHGLDGLRLVARITSFC